MGGFTQHPTAAGGAASSAIDDVSPRIHHASATRKVRRGTAIAELAICLPVLVLVVFGSIEMCNAIHLRQTLTEAGYEGAIVGSQPRATEARIVQRVQAVLTARDISGSTVSVTGNGNSFNSLGPGELFTVRVGAPAADNIPGPIRFVTFSVVEAEVVGHKQE